MPDRLQIVASTIGSRAVTALIYSIKHCNTLNKNLQQFWALEDYRCDVRPRRATHSLRKLPRTKKTVDFSCCFHFATILNIRHSRDIVYKQLAQLEQCFKRDRTLNKKAYKKDTKIEFMRSYLDAGLMSLVDESEQGSERSVIYLPHHGVIKETSFTTKLRAVFDTSSKTSSGKSLNDVLRIGITSQSSLFEIVRFRFYSVLLTEILDKYIDRCSCIQLTETTNGYSGDSH